MHAWHACMSISQEAILVLLSKLEQGLLSVQRSMLRVQQHSDAFLVCCFVTAVAVVGDSRDIASLGELT